MPCYTVFRTSINEEADMELAKFFFQELRSGAIWKNGWKTKLREKIEQFEEKGETMDDDKVNLEFSSFSDEKGILPLIIQDVNTKEVLMFGRVNEEAWRKIIETKEVWIWSSIRGQVWHKGELSGNIMKVREIWLGCNKSCILLLVQVLGEGKVCHEGKNSCFSGVLKLCPNCQGELSLTSRKFRTQAVHYVGENEEVWYCPNCNYEE